MEFRWEALNELQRELDRTGVISDEFKRDIMALAMAVASEAYRAGRREEREEAAYWRIKPLGNSGEPDCYHRKFTTREDAENTMSLAEISDRYEVLGFNAAGKVVE